MECGVPIGVSRSEPFDSLASLPRSGHSPWRAFAMSEPSVREGEPKVSRMEAPPGFEPGMEVLQTSALPLGDGAD